MHAHVVNSCVGVRRERVRGGKGQAAAVVEGSAFAADFERALWVLARRRRVLVVGVGVLELPMAVAGRIAGMTPGEAYREYEDACIRVFAVMERGGYAA